MGSANDTEVTSHPPKRYKDHKQSQKAVYVQATSGYNSCSLSLAVEKDPILPFEISLADVDPSEDGSEVASEEDSLEEYMSTVNCPNAIPVSTGTAAAAITISVQIFPRNDGGPAQETPPGDLLPQEIALIISSPMTPAQPPWPISLYSYMNSPQESENMEARDVLDTIKPFVGNYSPNESFHQD